MSEILQIIFWISLGLVFWSYIGYLIFLKLVSMLRSHTVDRQDITPPVTLVVTAHNEVARIRQKIENCLELVYPKELVEIIIVSDASDDGTDEIVNEYAGRGVKLLRIPERKGKHYGQGKGIQKAASDLVVLSDATTFLKKDAVRKMVRCFADPKIGVVSGEDAVNEGENGSSGEGAYVRYEMKLRSLEARAGSLVGASGCFFAIRKKLADGWVDDMSSDFYMPIISYMKGYRTVPEPEAIGYYTVLGDPHREFHRKVRTVLHGLEVLFRFKAILNPFRYGFYSLQMFSHKLMRWLVPLCLVVMLVTSGLLIGSGLLYQILFAGQCLLYALALLAFFVTPLQRNTLFRIPLFFCMVNLSIAIAWFQFLTGHKQVVWTATQR
jgi:cellulose synthase/poly-beta-1,6-N-acetylglucosamine synthase-like glycosyltransferase